jgi:uncharacterized coiled-coil protein SlyX
LAENVVVIKKKQNQIQKLVEELKKMNPHAVPTKYIDKKEEKTQNLQDGLYL